MHNSRSTLTRINFLNEIYPPSQKTLGVSPRMNAEVGPSEAQRTKEGASADFAEEMKDTLGVSPWRLHFFKSTGAVWPLITPSGSVLIEVGLTYNLKQ